MRMQKHILLKPDDTDPASTPNADPPAAPKVAAKGKGAKSPREIDLEKKNAELENELSGFKALLADAEKLLKTKPTAPDPASGAQTVPDSTAEKGWLHEYNRFLGLED